MAGDWIKMRVLLPVDPKVIAITDDLAGRREFMDWLTNPVRQHCRESAYEHVDAVTLRHVTVTALLRVWSVVSERGKRDGACDSRVTHGNLYTVDDIAGVPGFGEAMASVGWVREDGKSLVFPNYLRDNSSADERKRDADRERQRRKRARDRGVTGERDNSVTVTHREEKRRVYKEEPPLTPPDEQGGNPVSSGQGVARKKTRKQQRAEDLERRCREQSATVEGDA